MNKKFQDKQEEEYRARTERLKARWASIEPNCLTGVNSFENAYKNTNYPYGFYHRCTMFTWVETDPRGKKGQRVIRQSSNPKGREAAQAGPRHVWCPTNNTFLPLNAPKASTYGDLIALYIDPESGYLESDWIGAQASKEQLDRWCARNAAYVESDEYVRNKVAQIYQLISARDALNARLRAEWGLVPAIVETEPVNISDL